MKDLGVVQGSEEQALPLVIGSDTVYVHTGIEKLSVGADGKEAEGLYQYREVQYSKDEYIRLLAERHENLENSLTDTQIALCDIFEKMGV